MSDNLSTKSKFDRSRQYRPVQKAQSNWNFIIYYIDSVPYFINSTAFQDCPVEYQCHNDVYLPVRGLCNDLLVIKSGFSIKPNSLVIEIEPQIKEFIVPILVKLSDDNPYLIEKLNILAHISAEKIKQWKLLYLALALVTFYPNQ